jgi:hypothetical protein
MPSGELTAQWINSDGSSPPTNLVYSSTNSRLYFTGSRQPASSPFETSLHHAYREVMANTNDSLDSTDCKHVLCDVMSVVFSERNPQDTNIAMVYP